MRLALLLFAIFGGICRNEITQNERARAHALVRDGRWLEVNEFGQKLVKENPKDGDGWFLVAQAKEGLGDFATAESYYRKSLKCPQWNFMFASYFKLGNILKARSEWTAAVQMYKVAVKLMPSFFNARLNYGVALRNLKRLDEAILQYKAAIDVAADRPEAFVNLAVALREKGDWQDAIRHNKKALDLSPTYPHAHYNLGVIYQHDMKNFDKALESYSLAAKSNFPDAYTNLATISTDLGRLTDAKKFYDEAIAKNLATARLHSNYCGFLTNMGQVRSGIDHCEQSLKMDPNHASGYYNLGNALRQQTGLDLREGQGIAKQRINQRVLDLTYEAIRLDPSFSDAYAQLGDTYRSIEDFDSAISSYRKALDLQPDSTPAFCNWQYTRLFACHWSDQPLHLKRLTDIVLHQLSNDTAPSFYECVHPYQALAYPFALSMLKRISQHHARKATRILQMESRVPLKAFSFVLSSKTRISIGYVSANYGDHPVSRAMQSVFLQHSRHRFHVYAIATTTADGTEWRSSIEKRSDIFMDVSSVSDYEAAETISAARIHVLVHLSGYTDGERNGIFAMTPAPIQIGYKGYAGSLGAKYIPWLLSDAVVTPPDYAFAYTEKLVLIPRTNYVNDYAQSEESRVTLEQAQLNSAQFRERHSLAQNAFIYCCFNQFYKFTEEMFVLWMRILKRVPGSVIWFMRFPSAVAAEPVLRKAAKQGGVDPTRLIFTDMLPSDTHVRDKSAAELFLDTLPYNAHGTAEDALWAAVPVLSLAGEGMAARMAASLVLGSNVSETIVRSLEEYEDVAVELGLRRDGGTLRAVLAQYRPHLSLFDTKHWVQQFEKVVVMLVQTTSSSYHIIGSR